MNTMASKLENKLKKIIIKKFNLGIDIAEFDSNKPMIEYGLGLDSVANLEFILEIEKAFGIDIDESCFNSEVLYSFDSLKNYLGRLLVKSG